MLKDLIELVQAKTGLQSRDAVLREINLAWREVWGSDDMPNSLQEITVEPLDSTPRITLPWYVDKIRAVKSAGRVRIELNTPRPYYQDMSYVQSPWTWRLLGTTPLISSITNATTVDVTIPVAETGQDVTVTLRGPTDNAVDDREEVVLLRNTTSVRSTKRFTDFTGISKEVMTSNNIVIKDSNDAEIAMIPNSGFEARNTIVQISDKSSTISNECRCFDVLYKLPAPYLFYDEDSIPFQDVTLVKVLEWFNMPKDDSEKKTVLYNTKATALLTQFNINHPSTEHKMDIARGRFNTQYHGEL